MSDKLCMQAQAAMEELQEAEARVGDLKGTIRYQRFCCLPGAVWVQQSVGAAMLKLGRVHY